MPDGIFTERDTRVVSAPVFENRTEIPASRAVLHLAATIADTLIPVIHPYKLVVRPTQNTLILAGDERAIVIGKALIGQIEGKPELFAGTDTAERVHMAETLVAHVLEHDFTLRLPGLIRPLRVRSMAQLAFADMLLKKDAPMMFGVGPAGTGKTHVALSVALSLLQSERYKHVVITRPHYLQAGEVMTPEIRRETVRDTQFKPVCDILSDLTSTARVEEMIQTHHLELAPTGLLSGRTFNNTILIVDDAQNLDIPTTRMAVTRMGENSRLIITGDQRCTQLRTNEPSGLAHLLDMVEDEPFTEVFRFSPSNVIRNRTVAALERLYDEHSS